MATDFRAAILLICLMAEAKAETETSRALEDKVQAVMPDLTGNSREDSSPVTENQEQVQDLHLQELGYYLAQALQHSLQACL